jgi:hypothetical protein
METPLEPMTADSVRALLEAAGAEVMARSGRSEHYSAPREFSFEVKALFPNGMGMHIVARQFNYRDPWEASGRVNDLVDIMLLKGGELSPLPKGYPFFQDIDEECGIDETTLKEIIACVSGVHVKVYELQRITGDLS